MGASAGIGRDLAIRIAQLPHKPKVLALARRADRLQELKDSYGMVPITADLNKIDGLKALITQIVNDHPELDALIYASGMQHLTDFKKPEDIDLTLLDKELDLNYRGFLHIATFILPHFLTKEQACIIPVSSGLAILPMATVVNYCATKAALHSVAMSLRASLRTTNVKIREILPPLVESELHDHQPSINEKTSRRDMLAKFWVPLDEYGSAMIKALVETDEEDITYQQVTKLFSQYEQGKQEQIDRMAKQS